MDDLIKYLYQFVLENRMESLQGGEEYRNSVRSANAQIKCVERYLNEEQRKDLRLMIDRIGVQNSIENEYIFRAALKLSRELNALLRT